MTDSSKAQRVARRLEGRLGLSSRRWEQLIETLGALILSLAALLTSWSGYQAGRWNGVMATNFSQAGALRVESTRASALAGRQTQIDLQLFGSWLDAYAAGNQQLAAFYRERFRDEFQPAFEAWLASQPLTNADALPSPFDQSEYQLAATAKAQQLETEASAAFERGTQANQIGDDYVFNAVLLALALFFAGIANRFAWLAVKGALLGMGLLLLLIGLFTIARFPIG
ncbi:MAG: hypothetical protein HGA45_08830 [Chloroflexales bacterium]|nr:hypothetical protein [Chloroflexales bacterium]